MIRVALCTLAISGFGAAASAGELDRETLGAVAPAPSVVAPPAGTELDRESPRAAHGWRGGYGYGGYGGYGYGGGYGGFGYGGGYGGFGYSSVGFSRSYYPAYYSYPAFGYAPSFYRASYFNTGFYGGFGYGGYGGYGQSFCY